MNSFKKSIWLFLVKKTALKFTIPNGFSTRIFVRYILSISFLSSRTNCFEIQLKVLAVWRDGVDNVPGMQVECDELTNYCENFEI